MTLSRGRCAARQRHCRGFTLVELMVALTGGLFISIFVFMLASQGSRFYQQEARISNATIGVMNGFQRLRADIARAGFLASPNVRRDPLVCSSRAAAAGWGNATQMLRDMGGVRLIVGGSLEAASGDLASFWEDNDLSPDQLIIAGSFSSADQFPVGTMAQLAPNIWTIFLQPNSPALARLGYRTATSQDDATRIALLQSVFTPDDGARVLRIVDRKGSHHYGVIDSVGLSTQDGVTVPFVELTNDITLTQETNTTSCGLQGLGVGSTINVVNFVRYGLQSLNGLEGDSTYDPIYSDQVAGTFEEKRSELVRVELGVDGNVIAGTTELVAEYAVDLKFGLTALNTTGNGSLVSFNETATDTNLLQYAGVPTTGVAAAPNRGPHLIRTIHARLAVRSREGDREGDINAGAVGIPGGLYRIGLGENGAAPFARVRTLQADIALRNHMRARWQ